MKKILYIIIKILNFCKGTVRQNRLVGVPLPAKKVAAKEMTRGSMKSTYTDDICTTVWMDSQAVFMMSNFTGPIPTGKILSYSMVQLNIFSLIPLLLKLKTQS